MRRPSFLSPLALAAVAASLAACASPGPPLAASEGVSLESCQQVTGSRIRSSTRTSCEPVGYPFRSFSQQDLQATGEIDLVEALRQLDPAFQ